MANQLISIGFGKETFTSASASLSAFVVEAPFERTLPGKKFKRQGQCQRFPASQHPEINGYLYLDSIADVPDGTIIVLQSSHRFRAAPISDGAIFIATRSTGPLLSVSAILPSAIEATTTGGFLVFQGRGDILKVDELEAYGIEPPKNYIRGFLDAEEVAECYTVKETAPALEDKPSFEVQEDATGEKVLLRQRPKRKLSLRRGT